MTDEPKAPDDAFDASDERMAEFLSDKASGLSGMRKELQGEQSDEASDLLGRVNALEFMGSLVGESHELPEVLGDYRITGLLGKGGMGTVYEAFQESLEREVAIKVLSPVYSADPTMRKRFRSEARLTASLHHQHIVPIYDYGEAAGFLYFAMEKVDGISLDKHISAARRRKQVALQPREAASRFAGVADALGHAHRRHLLHRDVKPGNLLVTQDGSLALADFGLSKVLSGAGEQSVRLTTQGGFLGTLHYASPEQALGQDLTPSADLYSLGVTLFEAVAGVLPRAGDNTEQLLNSILKGEPRRLREILPQAPKDMDAVLHKVLSRDPADRYPDGESLGRDLRRIGDGDPVQIRRQPILVRLWRRAKRNPWLTAATLSAAGLLLVAAALAFGFLRANQENQRSRYEILMFDALATARTQTGAAVGRVDRVVALTGFDWGDAGDAPVADEVESLLAEAAGRDAADDRASAMLAAYRADPEPSATELIRRGNGYRALALLDPLIADVGERSSRGDRAAELELYQLYVARAVANLTESVANVADARLDLARANLLRPGAFLPRALGLVTDLAQANGAAVVVEEAKALVADGTPAERRLVGQLLWTAAGLLRAEGANLVRLDLDAAQRLSLLRFAGECWTCPEQGIIDGRAATGLERDVVAEVAGVLDAVSAGGSVGNLATRSAAVLDFNAGPDSPFERWRVVLQILRDPRGTRNLLGRDERVVTPEQELRGWDALLSLGPDAAWLRLRLGRIEGFCDDHEGLAGVPALRARTLGRILRSRRGGVDPDDVLTAAQNWVEIAVFDVDAHLLRCQAHLHVADLGGALDDAMRAVTLSASRSLVVARILQLFAEARELHADDDDVTAELDRLVTAFRDLPRESAR